jgi:transposase
VGGAAERPAAAQHGERLFRGWDDDRTLDRIHHALYARCLELAGREISPTAAIIDSQSVKSAEKGRSIDPCGYDAGKINHLLVDTEGLLLCAIVHAADVQDRDGGMLLMSTLFGLSRAAETLRRQRLSGAEVSAGPAAGLPADQRRDR